MEQNDIKKAFADPAAADMAEKMVRAFSESGLELGEDFVVIAEDEKLRFSFIDAGSLSLAIRTLRGE